MCPTIGTNNAFVTLVYVDATQGWLPTDDSNSEISAQESFITASGGTVTTSGDYKIHTFDADGNFIVSAAGSGPALATDVSYMVVAGGGGGGWCTGGGGGTGGPGGGGNGGFGSNGSNATGKGSGGGGASNANSGGTGSDGTVIIRMATSDYSGTQTGGS